MRIGLVLALFVAGGVSACFTILHGVMFYSLLNPNLISPDPLMVRPLLQTFNSVTLLIVGAITYFSFRYADEMPKTGMGRSLLAVFGLFYLIRIASEFVFMGFSGTGSLVIIVLCLIPAVSYLVAATTPSSGASEERVKTSPAPFPGHPN